MFSSFCHRTTALKSLLAAMKKGERLMILAYGDSNTCNSSYTKGYKQWPELLQQELRHTCNNLYIHLFNGGLNGDTSANLLQRFATDAKAMKPAVAFLSIGTNDRSRISNEDFEKNLNELAERFKKINCLLVFRTTPPVMELKPAPRHIYKKDEALMQKNAIMRKVAKERKLPLVDTYAAWEHLEDQGLLAMARFMTDPVHLNPRGHRLVTRQILQAFSLEPSLSTDSASNLFS